MEWSLEHFSVLVSLAVATATGLMAWATFAHVRETKENRKILANSLEIEKNRFQLENAPSLFVNKIETIYRIDLEKNLLLVAPNAEIINGGKSAANSIIIKHIIQQKNIKEENSLMPTMEIYPGQKTYIHGNFKIDIPKDLAETMAKELNKKVPFTLFPKIDDHIYWSISISFKNIYDEDQKYESKYVFNYPQWSINLKND